MPLAYLTVVFCLTYAFAYADRDVMRLVYEPIRLTFKMSDTQATLLTGAPFGLVYTIAAVPLGRLVDRVNRSRLLLAAAVVWSLGTIGCGLSHDPGQLVAARIAVALGEAALGPCVVSLMTDFFPQDIRGRVIGLIGASSVVGTSLAQIGGGRLLNTLSKTGGAELPVLGHVLPWRAAFLTVGLLSVVVLPMIARLREPVRKEVLTEDGAILSSEDRISTWRYFRTHRRLIGYLFGGYGLMILANEAIFAWTPIYAIRHYHLAVGDVGANFGLIILIFGASGPLIGGWISDRIVSTGRQDGRVVVGLTGLAGSAGAALLLPFAPGYGVYLCGVAIHAFSATLGAASAVVIIQDAFPNRLRGQANAVYGFIIHFIAVNFAPLAVALLSDYVLGRSGGVLTAALVVAAPTMAISGALLRLLRRRLVAVGVELVAAEPAGS